MRKLSNFRFILHLLIGSILFGCSIIDIDDQKISTRRPSSTPAPISTQTPHPSDTPTPTPQFDYSAILLQPDEYGGLKVMGFIQNSMDTAASKITIEISLYESGEVAIAKQQVTIPILHLQPGELFPFNLVFSDVQEADRAEVQLVEHQESTHEDVELEVEFAEPSFTEDGAYALMGWISNQGNVGAQINNFYLSISQDGKHDTTLIVPNLYPSSLLPSQSAPFLVILDHDPTTASITPYIDAIEIQKLLSTPFSFPQVPDVNLDSQGNLILNGTIRNEDSMPRKMSCLVALQNQEQLISISRVQPPIPINPNETRAFGISDFPAWKKQVQDLGLALEDIQIAMICDSLASSGFEGQIIPLHVEVLGFEKTGSSLIIRGQISNHSGDILSSAVVQADLRSIDGLIHATNWALIEQTINPEATSTFVLPVSLPKGTTLSEMEIDVRAIALLNKSELPY